MILRSPTTTSETKDALRVLAKKVDAIEIVIDAVMTTTTAASTVTIISGIRTDV